MSKKRTDEHMKKLSSNIFNSYVKLTRLSKEDIERYTGQTTIEHTSWQSTEQAIGVDVGIESTDGVEEKTMQENRIITITEGSTAFSNNMENVNRNEFICQICHDNVDSYEEYLVHKKIIHRCKPFVCKFCNTKFVLNIHLRGHMTEHNDKVRMSNSSVSPSEIQSSSKSNLTINPNRNNQNSELTSKLAKICLNTSISINESTNFTHNLSVTDPNTILQKNKCKAFKCVNCVFATDSETEFLNHRDICNNTSKGSSKIFQCNLCTKTFITHCGLNGHLKYHTYRNERISKKQRALEKIKNRDYKNYRQQIICNMCDKKFFLKKTFDKHLLTHTNGISNDTSINESNSHDNLVHCSYCNRSFKSIRSLGQHNRQSHPLYKLFLKNQKPETVECTWCSLVIVKRNLPRHIKNIHSKFF